MPGPIYTIGHSNHPIALFIGLLRGAAIELVVDVRSIPASRRWPQYGKAALARALAEAGIEYHWLGAVLGGKPQDGERADYERMAKLPGFRAGLEEVMSLAQTRRLAVMCAEREPLHCHRTALVGCRLAERGVELQHLLADGSIEQHPRLEDRLLHQQGLDDLLAAAQSREERVRAAWRMHGARMTGT